MYCCIRAYLHIFCMSGKARIHGLKPISRHAICSPKLILSHGILRACRVERSHNQIPGDLFFMLKAPERSQQPSRLHHPTPTLQPQSDLINMATQDLKKENL